MPSIQGLLEALDERTIAREVGIPHDEARMNFALHSNTVNDFDEFADLIGHYYNHHFTQCVSGGGGLPRAEAVGRAKEILEREYRRRQGDIVTAYNDAHDGTNGGLRHVCDVIAEALKAEAVERHVREVFDARVAPNSWDSKVRLIQDFIAHCGVNMSSSI